MGVFWTFVFWIPLIAIAYLLTGSLALALLASFFWFLLTFVLGLSSGIPNAIATYKERRAQKKKLKKHIESCSQCKAAIETKHQESICLEAMEMLPPEILVEVLTARKSG